MSERAVHLVGIGGAGMSALARLAAQAGYRVSGSDRDDSGVLDALRGIGVRAGVGHGTEALPPRLDTVVVSTAVADDNPEVLAARDRDIPVVHRSQFLAELMTNSRGLAVAGAHGKSTTSAMLASALGDVSACIGATIEGGGGTGARWGADEWFVAEADESDRSLLNLHPEAAILLNVDHDHHATFPDLESVRETFRMFIAGLPTDGLLVVGPDEQARLCARDAPCEVRMVGDVPGSSCTVERPPGVAGAVLVQRDGRRIPVPLALPGLHNATNAACALVMAEWCGVPMDVAAERLAGFRGVGRRLEERGVAGGVRVVDDYAHHPAEILATLSAVREYDPARVVVIFQPHLPSRTRALAAELGASLSSADLAIVTEVYLAREEADPEAGGRRVVEAVGAGGAQGALYAASLAEAVDLALEHIRPGDLVLTMGAGDITSIGQELVARLQKLYPDGDDS